MLNNFLASLPFMTETRADMIVSAFLPMVKAGFMVSLPLAVASFLIGMVIAIAVALVRIMPSGGIVRKILLKLVETYISIIRGTPLLVQLVIVFYGLPSVGIFIDPIPAAIIGFSLNVGAYASETIRLYADFPPHRRAAGIPRRRAAFEQRVYRLVQKHLACGGGDGNGIVPRRAGNGKPYLRLPARLYRSRFGLLVFLQSAVPDSGAPGKTLRPLCRQIRGSHD